MAVSEDSILMMKENEFLIPAEKATLALVLVELMKSDN